MLQKPFHILSVAILLHFQSATVVQCCQRWQLFLPTKSLNFVFKIGSSNLVINWLKLITNVKCDSIATHIKQCKRQNISICERNYMYTTITRVRNENSHDESISNGHSITNDENFLFLRWDLIIYFWTCHRRGSTSPSVVDYYYTIWQVEFLKAQSRERQCCQLVINIKHIAKFKWLKWLHIMRTFICAFEC